jgi:hypothetical protein
MTCHECRRAALPGWSRCEAHLAALLRRMGLA